MDFLFHLCYILAHYLFYLLVGRVVCLEKGCEDAVIVLSKHLKVADGGQSVGIGSLDPYRVHRVLFW